MTDTLPTRYEQDSYGFRVEVVTEVEFVEERQYRLRRAAARKEKRLAAWAAIDWHAVQPLPEEERWTNEPGYQESLYPYTF